MLHFSKKKKQGFISHCSDDKEVVLALQNVLSELYDSERYTFFNTSSEDNSSLAGDERPDMLREAMDNSDVMIAVLTDSYIRSIISVSEISYFMYSKKKIIPIVYSDLARDFLYKLVGSDLIYIDAIGMDEKIRKNPEAAKNECDEKAKKFIATMNNCGFEVKSGERVNRVLSDLFFDYKQAKATRPYIGSRDVYESLLKYCFEYGVMQMGNTSLPYPVMKERLTGYKDIYILSTTGRSIVHALSSNFFPEILKQGTNITVLMPNRYSDFVEDVAEIESPSHIESNSQRLSDEFCGVMNELECCLEHPDVKDCPNRGHIYVGCCYTLLRQTITLGVDEDKIWGWMSLTIPPKKTVEGTPSFEFCGNKTDQSMAKLAYEHILSIKKISENRGTFVELKPDDERITNFYLEKKNALSEWRDMYNTARVNTLERRGNLELIEIAAQHPLNEDGTPGTEFAARLDFGVKLYKEILESGGAAKVYVPGSRHVYEGIADPVSLSASGKAYLIEKGIPEKDILGPETNVKYKQADGVYNSADECYVASSIYKRGSYHRLHCVCSSNQMTRKKLFYLAFGVVAVFHTVDVDGMFHDDITELLQSVPNVIYKDHTWQDVDSECFVNSRLERRPKNGDIN